MENLKAIISYAMRMEKDARDFYEYYSDKVSSNAVKKVFDELIEMEENHYSMLKVIYDKLEEKDPPIGISWVVDNTSKEKNPSMFADNAELLGDEKSISDLSIVRMAYLMETDFAFFYTNASKKTSDEKAKKFLIELSEWETSHANIMKIKYEALLNSHWGNVSELIFK